jgi:phage terminase large subunit-like protein
MVARWIEAFLVHGEGDALGQPIHLEPFQRYILNRKYEYDPKTGRLLYDRTLFGLGKGNAKTELMANDALGRLAGPIAPLSPNIPVAAASWEQANRLFGAARLALEEGPLAEAFKSHIFEDRISHPDRPGVLSRIAAIAGTNDGGLPSDVYEDELHEWAGERRERVDVVLGNSLHKRTPRAVLPDGRVCIGGQQNRISTSGDSPDSLLRRLYDHGRKVAAGEVEDPRYLFLWWEAGDEHDLDTEKGLTAAILEANPAVGSFLSLENLRDRFHDPTLFRFEFERYHLNRWVSAPDAWIALDTWMSRRHRYDLEPDASRDDLAGRRRGRLARLRRIEVAGLDGAPRLHGRRAHLRREDLGARPAGSRVDGPADGG